MAGAPPCLIFEDDDLLVVNKPPGINTHAPHPHAGEGLYEWLRNREARWAHLAILHRLDKETSGVLVFGKTSAANRSLTSQFTERTVRKTYLLITDRRPSQTTVTLRSALKRVGDRYQSRPVHAGAELAETRFQMLNSAQVGDQIRAWLGPDFGLGQPRLSLSPSSFFMLEAKPVTGRTHQIRVQAASLGWPILGDVLYGGSPARRLFLHAQSITLLHPRTQEEMTFHAPVELSASLRKALVESELTDAYRLIHGASDGWPGWYVDKLGAYLLAQSERPPDSERTRGIAQIMTEVNARGVYYKILRHQVSGSGSEANSPRFLLGESTPAPQFCIRENGLEFELSFNEGYSVGLFLDQRENRRRLLSSYAGAGFPLKLTKGRLLNAFSYTCGFSVCAAHAGAITTNLDLSRKYLDWGKRNFLLNRLVPDEHEFIQGDVFEWLRRFARKRRQFDFVLLDPPTFSRSKKSGAFRAEEDYRELVSNVLPLLARDGVLFCSCNAANWPVEKFLEAVQEPIRAARRKVVRDLFVPQPPDFPISSSEPSYLKTVWIRLD